MSRVPCCSTVVGSGFQGITDNVNIGAGAGWFAGLDGTVAEFKTLTVSNGLGITVNPETIDISGGGAMTGNNDIILSWVEKQKPFFEVTVVAYSSTESPAFIYRGSAAIGTPSAMKVILAVGDATKPVDVRLRDVTNGLTIAEVTGLVNLAQAIVDLGAINLANVPVGEAIFEVQCQSTLGGAANLYSSALIF